MAYKHKQDDVNDTGSIEQGVLHPDDILYPESLKKILGKHAPTELYYRGNVALLKEQAVGFCGSRKATDKGLDTAADCAEQVAQNRYVVISGNAPGVDSVAHRSAMQVGGSTIFVLPEGISHFRIKKELRDVWDWSRALVISQFKPNEPWQTYRAMTRNQVIIALSGAMVVIEAQESGGTIEAGKTALKLHVPLFVAEYQDMMHTPGSSVLLSKGASTIKKSKSGGRAKLDTLLDAVQNFSANFRPPHLNQLPLF